MKQFLSGARGTVIRGDEGRRGGVMIARQCSRVCLKIMPPIVFGFCKPSGRGWQAHYVQHVCSSMALVFICVVVTAVVAFIGLCRLRQRRTKRRQATEARRFSAGGSNGETRDADR